MSRTIVNRGSSVGDGKDIELVQYIFEMYRVLFQFLEKYSRGANMGFWQIRGWWCLLREGERGHIEIIHWS